MDDHLRSPYQLKAQWRLRSKPPRTRLLRILSLVLKLQWLGWGSISQVTIREDSDEWPSAITSPQQPPCVRRVSLRPPRSPWSILGLSNQLLRLRPWAYAHSVAYFRDYECHAENSSKAYVEAANMKSKSAYYDRTPGCMSPQQKAAEHVTHQCVSLFVIIQATAEWDHNCLPYP